MRSCILRGIRLMSPGRLAGNSQLNLKPLQLLSWCERVSTSVDLPLSHECKSVLAYGAEEEVHQCA
jgi:hypothetical protein